MVCPVYLHHLSSNGRTLSLKYLHYGFIIGLYQNICIMWFSLSIYILGLPIGHSCCLLVFLVDSGFGFLFLFLFLFYLIFLLGFDFLVFFAYCFLFYIIFYLISMNTCFRKSKHVHYKMHKLLTSM